MRTSIIVLRRRSNVVTSTTQKPVMHITNYMQRLHVGRLHFYVLYVYAHTVFQER